MTNDEGPGDAKKFPLAAKLLGQIGGTRRSDKGPPKPLADKKAPASPATPSGDKPGLAELGGHLLERADALGDPPGYELLDDVRKQKILRRGFETDAVGVLQRLLNELGHPCPQHGRFDFDTEMALRHFQRASSCEETAKVDELTLDALDRALGLRPRKRYGSKR